VNIMTSRISNKVRQNAFKLLVEGFREHCMNDGGVIVNQQKKSAEEVAGDLQRRAEAEDKVSVARGALKGAILDREKVEAETAAVYHIVRQIVLAQFAGAPDILAKFGLAPPKPRKPRTVEEKLTTVQKSASTRVARHTMGPKQRLKITGDHPTPEGPQAPAPAPHTPATPPTPIAPLANGPPTGGGR
jgi:hypothetical protein